MKLFSDIQNLLPYLVSIRVIENVITIDMSFPSTWKFLKKHFDEKTFVEEESPDENYRFFSFVCEMSEENFNTIYSNIIGTIKFNKEREEKEKLFQDKVNELRSFFDKQNLEDLKKLKFGPNDPTAKTKKQDLIEKEIQDEN